MHARDAQVMYRAQNIARHTHPGLFSGQPNNICSSQDDYLANSCT